MTPIKKSQILVALLGTILCMSSAAAQTDTLLPYVSPHAYYVLDQDHLQEKTQECENLFTRGGMRALTRRAQ